MTSTPPMNQAQRPHKKLLVLYLIITTFLVGNIFWSMVKLIFESTLVSCHLFEI